MLIVGIIIEILHQLLNLLCRDFSIFLRYCQNLMSTKFNSARFMGCNMTCIRSHNSLIGFQKCIDHCGIGLCSTNQQKYICLRCIAGFSDLFFRIFCVWILTIAHCFLQVRLHQLFHDRRMCTLHVVTGEI